MITYHDAFAKANHYLDDADPPSSLLYMDALAVAGISVSKHENFSKLVMRPRVYPVTHLLLLIKTVVKFIPLERQSRWKNIYRIMK